MKIKKYAFLYYIHLFNIPHCLSCNECLDKEPEIHGLDFTTYMCKNDICKFSREHLIGEEYVEEE